MKTIISLAARGDGIADDGSYCASTAPGDIVQDAFLTTMLPFSSRRSSTLSMSNFA